MFVEFLVVGFQVDAIFTRQVAAQILWLEMRYIYLLFDIHLENLWVTEENNFFFRENCMRANEKTLWFVVYDVKTYYKF